MRDQILQTCFQLLQVVARSRRRRANGGDRKPTFIAAASGGARGHRAIFTMEDEDDYYENGLSSPSHGL